MALSCDCGWDDYDWYYEIEDVFRIAMTDYKCYGCCKFKKNGDHVRHIFSHEVDEDGDEINYQIIGRICEECSDLYDSLKELGFCLTADWGFIKEAHKEYIEDYVKK